MNATCWVLTSKPAGNGTIATKILPGVSSLIWTPASLASTSGSDNISKFVLLFWIVTVLVIGLGSGPGGRTICGGETSTAGCTFAITSTVTTGALVEEVLRMI